MLDNNITFLSDTLPLPFWNLLFLSSASPERLYLIHNLTANVIRQMGSTQIWYIMKRTMNSEYGIIFAMCTKEDHMFRF